MDLVNGSVPAEQLEKCVEELRRDPPHPGSIAREVCEWKHLSPRDAARAIGVDLESFERVLEGRAPITAKLALRMEAAGWPPAQIWMRMQVDYDLAQERLRLERDSGTAPMSARGGESTVAAS